MNTADTIAIGIFIATAILIFFGVRSWRSSTSTSKTTSTASTAAGTPDTSTSPASVPAAAAKSAGTVTRGSRWMVGILLVILASAAYFGIFRPLVWPTAKPQATAPKRALQQHTIIRPLEFLGGEKVIRGPRWIGIPKGGRANFRANLPIVINGKYKIHYHGRRVVEDRNKVKEKDGQDFLLINRGKGHDGNPFCVSHMVTDIPIPIIFFADGYDIGMPGEAKYFRQGDNYFTLWADGDLLVQLDKPMYVKITYWK